MIKDGTQKVKILYVDDIPAFLRSFERVFRNNYEVHIATSGIEALALIRDHEEFSVIVSDLSMPGMDGVEFFEKVKEISPNSTRIMLSGHADLKAAVDSVNKGQIFKFLIKPISIEDMRAAITDGITHYFSQIEIKDPAMDHLTGFYNYDTIIRIVSREIGRVQRYFTNLSIAMFSIDSELNTKANCGEKNWKNVRKMFADMLQDNIRPIDMAGIYSSDKHFIVVLPDSTKEDAHIVAERLRSKVENHTFEFQPYKITISGGIIEYTDEKPHTIIEKVKNLNMVAEQDGGNAIRK